MKSREWEILKKAEKNIQENLIKIIERQEVINNFFLERLTIMDYNDLEKKLKEFEDSKKPEKNIWKELSSEDHEKMFRRCKDHKPVL